MSNQAEGPQPETAKAPAPLRREWRYLLSAALLWHLAAVFAAPLNLATAESSFARPLFRAVRPYIQMLYLNHGYFFFAPDPGPSHLVRYELQFDDERPTIRRMFPDLNRHFPRLLYHRHFMLAEHLNAMYAPPEPPPDINPDDIPYWRIARSAYHQRWEGFRRHLAATHGADRVLMWRVEHSLLTPAEVLEQGRDINAAELYRELPETYVPPLPPPRPPAGRRQPAPRPAPGVPLRRPPGASPLETLPLETLPLETLPSEKLPLESLP